MNSKIRKKLVSLILSISLICQITTPIAYATQPNDSFSNETPTEILFSGLKQSVTTGAAITIDPNQSISSQLTNISIGTDISINNETVTYMGDLSSLGINIPENEYKTNGDIDLYIAGEGYALITWPTNDSLPYKLTLHNATINTTQLANFNAISLYKNFIINLEGNNFIKASGIGIESNNIYDLVIEGEGLLDIESFSYSIVKNGAGSNSEKIIIRGNTKLILKSPIGIECETILFQNNCDVTIFNGENVNDVAINAFSVVLEDNSKVESKSKYPIIHITGCLSVNLNTELNAIFKSLHQYTIYGKITIPENSTLDLHSIYNLDLHTGASIINNGTLVLNQNFNYEKIKSLNITNNGILKLGTNKIQLIGEKIYNDAGEITSDLNLSYNDTPTEPTYYSAGLGYLLFVPANGSDSARITFHKLDLNSFTIIFPNVPINLILEETSNINTLYILNPVNITGDGILNLKTCYNYNSTNNIIVAEGTQFNARYKLKSIDGIFTTNIYGNYLLDFFTSLTQNDKLNLMPNATLTITNTGTLLLEKDSSTNNIILNQGSSIVNNGTITLPKGSTVEQIKALSLTGTGIVNIVETYENGNPLAYTEYTNTGEKLNTNPNTNVLIFSDVEITEADNLGYTWTKSVNNGQEVWTLNLNNTIIDKDIEFQVQNVIININGENNNIENLNFNIIDSNCTFTGSGILNSNHIYTDKITFTNKANITLLNLDLLSSEFNITDGSTLTIKNSGFIAIIDGKLNVDTDSKLITDTIASPFLVEDFTGTKTQSELISLPGLPAGTKLSSIKGPSGTVYWTLAPKNGSLSIVLDPNGYEKIQGYATGKLIFEKQSNSGGSSSGGSGGSSGGSSSSSSSSNKNSNGTPTPAKTPEELKQEAEKLAKEKTQVATSPRPAIDSSVFTDISNHWAKDDIAFVTQRGLFGGTSKDKFSPNMPMTRGMFVTVLGRLANADVSSSSDSKFKDVKKDAYYASYVEWANKNNIISGTAKDKFSPNQPITKAQMEAIIANYSRFAGVNPPKLQSDTKGIATRAQVSAVLRRYIEFLESLKK